MAQTDDYPDRDGSSQLSRTIPSFLFAIVRLIIERPVPITPLDFWILGPWGFQLEQEDEPAS